MAQWRPLHLAYQTTPVTRSACCVFTTLPTLRCLSSSTSSVCTDQTVCKCLTASVPVDSACIPAVASQALLSLRSPSQLPTVPCSSASPRTLCTTARAGTLVSLLVRAYSTRIHFVLYTRNKCPAGRPN